MKRSYDNGHTWKDLELFIEEKGILGKNKPLFSGSLGLIPVEREDTWSAMFLRSEDRGKTWELIGDLGKEADAHLIQPTVVMLKDGTLMAYMRSQEDYIFVTYSQDRGRSWSKPEPTSLPNPNSGIDMVRLKSGNLALVYNPTKSIRDASKTDSSIVGDIPVEDLGRITGFNVWGPRTPLDLVLSTDEGKTWPHRVRLEEGSGAFSYPAVIQSRDGTIHITYTYKRTHIRHVRIKEEEIIKEYRGR
jgi:predicted neuraminidase